MSTEPIQPTPEEQPLADTATNNAAEPMTRWIEGFKNWFDEFLDLREGMDRASTIESIHKGKLMRGSNAWMLVCSIMIAALGLNLNSGAVIIGAMLISPLMNPILGLGLGVATNDREALTVSMRHFIIAIVIALITSTVYFWLTPLKEFTEEMAGRTKPNVLDALVAVFGGLAGIISVSRADKTNAIPGVAIATALMPPLCVSGYGIASGDWDIAVRAFYLFFLNSSIIACTAYLIIRLLRFPYRTYVNEKEARRSQLLVGIFAFLILVPSVFIMFEVIDDFKIKRGVREFVKEEFASSCLEYKYIEVNPDSNLLVMELLNREIEPNCVEDYEAILAGDPYHVKNTYILAIPDNNLSIQRLNSFQYQLSAFDNVEAKIDQMIEQRELESASAIQNGDDMLAYRLDSAGFSRFSEMVRLSFTKLESFSVSSTQTSTPDSLQAEIPRAAIRWEKGMRATVIRNEEIRLQSYLQLALRVDTVAIIVEGE